MIKSLNLEELRSLISQVSSIRNSLQCNSENILRLRGCICDTFEGIQSDDIIACMQRMEIAVQDIRKYESFFDDMVRLFQNIDSAKKSL